MTDTYEYTYDDYPNMKVIVYRGADGTYETDLDKIIENISISKNQHGYTTIHIETVHKYIDISSFSCYWNNDEWFCIRVDNCDYITDENYSVDILIKSEEGMDRLIYKPLKYEYQCVIIPYEFYCAKEKL